MNETKLTTWGKKKMKMLRWILITLIYWILITLIYLGCVIFSGVVFILLLFMVRECGILMYPILSDNTLRVIVYTTAIPLILMVVIQEYKKLREFYKEKRK